MIDCSQKSILIIEGGNSVHHYIQDMLNKHFPNNYERTTILSAYKQMDMAKFFLMSGKFDCIAAYSTLIYEDARELFDFTLYLINNGAMPDYDWFLGFRLTEFDREQTENMKSYVSRNNLYQIMPNGVLYDIK